MDCASDDDAAALCSHYSPVRTPESTLKCLILKWPTSAIFIRTKFGHFYPFFGSILGGGRFYPHDGSGFKKKVKNFFLALRATFLRF
jgi:hypothetical protein